MQSVQPAPDPQALIWIDLEIMMAKAWQVRPRAERVAADDDKWRKVAFRSVAEPRPAPDWSPKGDWPCPRCPGLFDMISGNPVGRGIGVWTCDKCALEMRYTPNQQQWDEPFTYFGDQFKFYDQGKEVSQYDIVLSTIFNGKDGSAALDGEGRSSGVAGESITIPDYSDAFFEGLSAAAGARAAEAASSGV